MQYKNKQISIKPITLVDLKYIKNKDLEILVLEREKLFQEKINEFNKKLESNENEIIEKLKEKLRIVRKRDPLYYANYKLEIQNKKLKQRIENYKVAFSEKFREGFKGDRL